MRTVALADVAEINPRGPTSRELSPQDICDFVPMAAVTEAGKVIVHERRKYSEVSRGSTAFQNDDVLVAKITPCYESLLQYSSNAANFDCVRGAERPALRPARA
jgi:type I restriction enzyme, S subunit